MPGRMPGSRSARLIVSFLAVLVLFAGAVLVTRCSRPTVETSGRNPKEDVRQAVLRYNEALSEGFETMDMQALNTVATRDQAYTEYYQMAALGESRVRLMATLKDIEVLDTRFETPETSTVDTLETWDYVHVSLDTSLTVRTEAGVAYRLTYRLVDRKGRWLVDEIKTTGQSWRAKPRASAPATSNR